MTETDNQHPDRSARQDRMRTLALASWPDFAKQWHKLGIDPAFEMVRGPEIGLVALRGRIGGGGAPFNFGEATATRATVKLDDGAIGHAIILGRDKAKARVAAVVDAMAQDPDLAADIEEKLIAPLREVQDVADETLAAETAATKVDFFTMVRGDN
ncbi:MAG: phosphonate C-P lyase system protein PhnG [Pseudomonadota bacterium]